MIITLDLDEEQTDALQAVVDARNAASGTAVTPEEHLRELAMVEVQRYTAAAYEESLRGIGEAARTLPYAARKQLTASVRAQISPQP